MKPAVSKRVVTIPQPHVEAAESGIVLIDASLRTVAMDHGASRILNGTGSSEPGVTIPYEIQQSIRARRAGDPADGPSSFTVGRQRYRYRIYSVQCERTDLPRTLIAIHLEAEVSSCDPIAQMAARYRLTEREAQALRGIALGLSTKELADRMNISPDTVKAFVRLIMIKLGGKTRTAIVVKLLDNDGS